jgi:starch synthase
MRILFAISEMAPYSKTGGLADVAYGLPKKLIQHGHEVTVITPRYGHIDVGAFDLRRRRTKLTISIHGRPVQGGYLEGLGPDGIGILFVDQPGYFERDGLYGSQGHDYPDNDERFAFFSRGVLEACRLCELAPDIVHCNDWQTGPVAALLETEYRDRPELNTTGTVFTIHDLANQGIFSPNAMMALGLPWSLFTPSNVEFFGKMNYLKSGLVFADKLTTVSHRYAAEILTPAFGCGLQGVLRERASDLRGILNGVDYDAWDPRQDSVIAARYSPEDLSGKAVCKAELQKRYGLPQHGEVPLIGCVSRLTTQKGIDLFIDAAEELLRLECQWCFVGQGEKALEQALVSLAARYPHRLAMHSDGSEELSHAVLAGADLLLMPSRFEPCGTSHLYGLRYGAIPMVTNVGALDDSIDDVSEGEGNGFKISEASGRALGDVVRRALECYRDRTAWQLLMRQAMNQDFSWELPARRYESVYRDVAALRATEVRESS